MNTEIHEINYLERYLTTKQQEITQERKKRQAETGFGVTGP